MRLSERVFRVARSFASPATTVVSILISIGSLYVAYDGARSSNTIATQALATATQANEIALGRIREPVILQFSEFGDDNFEFHFESPADLERELKLYVSLENDGRKSVEGAVFEVVGIESLTHRVDNPSIVLKNLPSSVLITTFNSAVQPNGSVHFDIRKLVLQYLGKLAPRIVDKNATYSTHVNVVLKAKGVGEAVAVGAPLKLAPRDRKLWKIVFKAGVLDSEIAKK